MIISVTSWEGQSEHPYSEKMEKVIVFFLNLFNTGVEAFRDLMKKHEKSWKVGSV
jgi:hypothetical protein